MKRDLQKLQNDTYDVLIVGGGINGAGIANLASLNGLKVALLEKGDFASGTSSKSTKLIHGGLRYLENMEFGLVKESLKERAVQLRSAPHLVHPLGFIIPVYKTDPRPLWMMRLGVWLYDVLSGRYNIHAHRILTVEEVKHLIDGIEDKDLTGGLMYWDAQMDDARLCLENILQARRQGADVFNYIEVKSLIKENGKAVGVIARDCLQDGAFEVRARKIICAVGPWTNQFMRKEKGNTPPKIRTTKGVHIVYKGQCCDHAIFIQAKDKRIFFIIPWMGNSLIGTTDTDYTDSPDTVRVEEEDIDYLFKEAARVFPKAHFQRENIITTFAGLRPLVYDEGSPGRISRKHLIQDSFSKIQYVMGGKYTTYRKIAEDSLSRILHKKKPFPTEEELPLYGGGEIEENASAVAAQYGLEESIIKGLMARYGTRYKDVLKLVEEDPGLKEIVCSQPLTIKAQIRYAVETELAQTSADILQRRLSVQYADADRTLLEMAIAQYLGALRG